MFCQSRPHIQDNAELLTTMCHWQACFSTGLSQLLGVQHIETHWVEKEKKNNPLLKKSLLLPVFKPPKQELCMEKIAI